MKFSNDPPEEKPYDFVPLPDKVIRQDPAGHHRFKSGLLSGTITGELVALTPVHLASGNVELTRNDRVPLVKAHFRTRGKIAIPGSSLKGAVRSIVEAITSSCIRVQSRAVRERLPKLQREESFDPCEVRDASSRLCPACRIFGAMSYQGQVSFADAVLVKGDFGTTYAPSLFAPRPYSQIYFDRKGQVRGRKFYLHGEPASGNVPLEVCTVGSRFGLRIDFVNLSEAELGVLLTAMGETDAPFAIKLGGAKPACRGSVEVIVNVVEVKNDFGAAVEFDIEPTRKDKTQWLRAAESVLIKLNLEKLRNILGKDENRNCPLQAY